MIPAETPDLKQLLAQKETVFIADELWRCLPPDTMIMTHDNIKPADNCFFDNPFLSLDIDNMQVVNSIPTQLCKRYTNEKLIKIETRTREIIVSKDHRLLTINRDPNFYCRHKKIKDIRKFIKEKFAKDIREKDRVLLVHKLPEPKKELIDFKTAQLIGYICADGNIEYPHRYAIHIDDQNKECLLKYEKLAKSLGFSTSMHKHKESDCYRLRLFGKEKVLKLINDISDSIFIDKSLKSPTSRIIDIPEKIVKSNNKVLGSFLRGFFDGEAHIRIDKIQKPFCKIDLGLGIKNRKLLEKIKYLLLRFGIESSKIKKMHTGYKISIRDSLSLKRFKKYIGFSHPKKKLMLNIFNRFFKDFNSVRKIFGDVEISRVISVKEVEPEFPYLVDFTVPAFENYIANGFIVHNSIDSRCSMLQVKESEKKQIKNKIITDILSASRKAFVTVIYTSQTISQVDRRIREVTDFVVYPILKGSYICTLNFFVGPNPKASALDKQVRFYVEPIFAMYNTYERVYPLEEGYTSEKVYYPIYKNPAWVKYLKDQGLTNEQIIQKSLRVEKMINPNLDVDKYYKNAKIEI